MRDALNCSAMISSRPDGFIKSFEHLLELPVKHFVEPGEAAAFALENEVWIIQRGVIYQHVGFGLCCDSFQPVALRPGPVVCCQQLLQRMIDALVVGHERVADGSLADVSNDACGDVLVGHFAPCGSQIGFW